MKENTRIAVVGGTGKSGKYLVRELIDQGVHFKALIRNPEKFIVESPSVEIVYGDICNIETVRSLLSDCDAVISTLGMGIPYNNPIVCSTGTKNILKTMDELGIGRYIVVTGLNVDTPFDKKSPKTKFATDWMYQNYPKTTTDRQDEYNLLLESKLDWTLVRLPLIELTDERREVKPDLEDCLGDKISATDLAHFLIGQFDDKTYIKKAPFLTNV
ncbi:NAD(P)-dependent oxidoreductase [Maribacter halichondriae]|uniref:NAD(P)-dependent oxidoreductase n=1 Tax=Maribacter halichondriae TaxID=2980554 RepID=UPI002359B146|nr:NAD(P)H-binding protein [Maribacter sp. Hal144]